MNKIVYSELVKVAKAKKTTTYSELVKAAKLNLNLAMSVGRNAIAEILRDIAAYENDHGRPMLTSVVVHGHDKMPGEGFFILGQALGRFSGKPKDKLCFFVTELLATHATYAPSV